MGVMNQPKGLDFMNEIKSLKVLLFESLNNNSLLSVWIPRKTLMKFFDYGDTQIRALEKNNEIVVSKIGQRKFYLRDSILSFINSKRIIL
jgi:hypothetical protein